MSSPTATQVRTDRLNCNVLSSPTLSVIIPAYNEQATVIQSLESVLSEKTPKEIIVVDDGSTDDTPTRIATWLESTSLPTHIHRLIWLQHRTNRGKGAAMRTGLAHAAGVYVIPFDADLELCATSFQSLIRPLIQGQAQFVIGVRTTQIRRFRLIYQVGVTLLNSLIRTLYGKSFQDSACCFKVTTLNNYKMLKLEEDGFEFCCEVLAKACRMDWTITQVSVDYAPRTRLAGKKISIMKDGVKAVMTYLRYRKWKA